MFKVLMLVLIFQLSDELKRLARMESQFRGEYLKLRAQVPERLGTGDGFFPQVQDFVTGLVDNTRTSYELEVILNHNPDGETWQVFCFWLLLNSLWMFQIQC